MARAPSNEDKCIRGILEEEEMRREGDSEPDGEEVLSVASTCCIVLTTRCRACGRR